MAKEEPAPRLAELFAGTAAAGDALRARHWRVAVAESCTGGLLGAALTAVPGSSEYVCGGVIAYANTAKHDLLDVDTSLIERHGAVSEEVAVAMAAGARRRFDAEVGVGITGVAGPGADEGGKPAGLVFVAVTSPAGGRVRRLEGDAGRERNRAHAVHAALTMLGELA
jgi:nicotinamide-nucleotide amidase